MWQSKFGRGIVPGGCFPSSDGTEYKEQKLYSQSPCPLSLTATQPTAEPSHPEGTWSSVQMIRRITDGYFKTRVIRCCLASRPNMVALLEYGF